jgi:hypothetical protein
MPFPDGTLLQGVGQIQVWVVLKGLRFRVANPEALAEAGLGDAPWTPILVQELLAIPSMPPDGTLVRDRDSKKILIMQAGMTLWLPSDEAFDAAGLDPEKIITPPRGSLASFPYGGRYPPRFPALLRSRAGRALLRWGNSERRRAVARWAGNHVVSFLLGVAAGVVGTLLVR